MRQLLAVCDSWWIHNLDLCSNVGYYFKHHQCYWKIICIDCLLKLHLKDQYYLYQLEFKVSLFSILRGCHTSWAKKVFWIRCTINVLEVWCSDWIAILLLSHYSVWHSLLVCFWKGGILLSLITETDVSVLSMSFSVDTEALRLQNRSTWLQVYHVSLC